MKKLILYFLAFVAAIWLGLKIQASSGYVFISYRNLSVETTLWVAILAVLLAFVIFYYLLRSLNFTFTFSQRFRKWRFKKKQRKSYNLTRLAIKELIEEHWSSAEKKALRAVTNENSVLIAYLTAACAAQQQHALNRRDNYLAKMIRLNKDATFTVNLAKAKLQIASKQWQEALGTLKKLYQEQPKQLSVLKLLTKVYQQLQLWDELASVLPYLQKFKVLSVAELNTLQVETYYELLKKLIQQKQQDIMKIENFWQKLPKQCKFATNILVLYIDYLVVNDLLEKAEFILRKVLFKAWDKTLLDKYGIIKSTKPVKQLKTAEKWLHNHPYDSDLFLCLGRLCEQQKLWGKAQHYLHESIKIKPTIEAYLELAKISKMQNKAQEVIEYYRNIVNILEK